MKSFINAKVAIKKLRLGAKKCFDMHVGNKHDDYKNIELFIDGWSVKEEKQFDTGKTVSKDTLKEDMNKISHIQSEKYLGQVLGCDCKNTINITNLRNKGIRTQNKIIQLLEKMPGSVLWIDNNKKIRKILLTK